MRQLRAMKPETTARKDAHTAETLPVFQHRHLSAIAAVLAEDRKALKLLGWNGKEETTGYPNGAYNEWYDICVAMAEMFQRSNPRFDRARFLRACGVAS